MRASRVRTDDAHRRSTIAPWSISVGTWRGGPVACRRGPGRRAARRARIDDARAV